MKYSYNWLKELSQSKLTPEKMAELLMMHSFEVEGLEKISHDFKNIVVGEILEIKKHPNADKLQLVKLQTTNNQLQTIQIICGAPNIKVGQKVPIALLGAKLPGGEIKEIEIRGIKSCGMLCAEDELGLGNNHSGILILEDDFKIGTSLEEALNINDTVLDVDILSNRGHDALSHQGLAREICVLEGRGLKNTLKTPKIKPSQKLKVVINDKDLCARYLGVVIENVAVQESPLWLKSRLLSCGFRPINNIVDATNYVMLEIGQPLHAFDFDLIKSADQKAEIIVRRAKKEEKITLLDETEKILGQNDLLITNNKEALAIAGIMGGINSGITNTTKNIVLESANFNATAIRKTRTKLNIKTDASDRFEKDIDPNLAEKAMARVIEIIQKTAGGKVEGLVDVYPKKINPWKIKLDLNYVNKLLGEKIPGKVVTKILNLLEIKTSGRGDYLLAEIPTVRIDLKTQEDLIEEIGRIYGYDKIRPQAPKVHLKPAPVNEQLVFEKTVKNILAGLGFDEIYNYSFYGFREAEMAGLEAGNHWELENPMNPEQALMRVSLIPNLLKNIHENLKYFKELSIFEAGRIYLQSPNVLPQEKRMLVGAIVLEKTKSAKNFYASKGFVDSLFSRLGIADYYYDTFEAQSEEKSLYLWHRSRMAEIKVTGQKESVGFVGEINPLVLANFDIEKRVAVFELDLEKLQKASEMEREFEPISKFPEITRDISLLSETGVTVDDILKVIQKAGGDLVLDVDLFDIFEKDGKTSYAFHLIFGSKQRTLAGAEVEVIMSRLISELQKNLKVSIRQ